MITKLMYYDIYINNTIFFSAVRKWCDKFNSSPSFTEKSLFSPISYA